MVELVEERGTILRAYETAARARGCARRPTAAGTSTSASCSRELRPGADVAALAHLLLAPLAAETWGGLRREAGLGREALTALVAAQWSATIR